MEGVATIQERLPLKVWPLFKGGYYSRCVVIKPSKHVVVLILTFHPVCHPIWVCPGRIAVKCSLALLYAL